MTVFTPTYNRAYIIGRLYESLLAQTSDDFQWMVVDDGSTDDTRSVIEGFAAEGKLDIIYIHQENGGKQRAHNAGVERCGTELFFCVDSDDELIPEAVEECLALWKTKRHDSRFAGIIALCGTSDGAPLGTRFPEGLESTTMWDLYYKHHHKGDTSLVYRTEILRQYPFVVEPGEKFIGETYVYHQIDQHYELAVLPRVIRTTEYLPDGYTKNVRKVTRDNPVGYMRLKRDYIDYADTLTVKAQSTALYLVGAYFAGCFWRAYRELPNRLMATLAVPVALLLVKTVYRPR